MPLEQNQGHNIDYVPILLPSVSHCIEARSHERMAIAREDVVLLMLVLAHGAAERIVPCIDALRRVETWLLYREMVGLRAV
jgi:hypothetical protein